MLSGKKNNDFLPRACAVAISFFVFALLCLVFVFIFVKSIPGLNEYGFKNIFLTTKFDPKNTKSAGIWLPTFIMLIIGLISTTLAAMLGIRTALFLKFRVSSTIARKIKIIVDLLASVPSVIYGVFCLNTFSPIFGKVFGIPSDGTVISASVVLSFMVLPIIVSFVYHAVDSINNDFLLSSIALGNTKTYAIHKVIKKKIRPEIIAIVVFSLTRILCETAALNMILKNTSDYENTFSKGFFGILVSDLKPLGAIIPAFFSVNKTSNSPVNSVLLIFGIIIFVLVIVANAFILYLIKFVNTKRWNRFTLLIHEATAVAKRIPIKLISYATPKISQKIYRRSNNINEIDIENMQKNRSHDFYTIYKIFFDYFAVIVAFSFTTWILLDISIKGIIATFSPDSTIFSNHSNSTGRALINTIIMIFLSMIIALPLSLFVAINLAEFSKNGRLKRTIIFFMDSLASTPSILFGLFGLFMFINSLGLSSTGTNGNSLIAGILTVALLIIPIYTRGIQIGLENVDRQLKLNSFALGAGKWATIWKVTVPSAMNTIINSSILIIGRILSETSPLYITAGLSSSEKINLFSPGQTLTTRIYSQTLETDPSKVHNTEYSSALLSILLILIFILIWQLLLPFLIIKKNQIRMWFQNKYQLLKFSQFIS